MGKGEPKRKAPRVVWVVIVKAIPVHGDDVFIAGASDDRDAANDDAKRWRRGEYSTAAAWVRVVRYILAPLPPGPRKRRQPRPLPPHLNAPLKYKLTVVEPREKRGGKGKR